jgi:hypothetical protein
MEKRAMTHALEPLVVAYGMGVDSTAMLVGFTRLGIRPDLILFADTGGEKEETYAYRPIMNAFLAAEGYPAITVVRYLPRDFKYWPPYHSLEENCLTNGTLPSLAFGFKSCSQKWKVAPQHKYLQAWRPAIECWAQGGRVKKVIGYDAGPRDMRRRTYADHRTDPRYKYWYPLIEWGWDRKRCMEEIEHSGLPVPPKSSCFFCPAMKPAEVALLPPDKLRRIVVMEARAKPRLTKIQGLWRTGSKGCRGGEKRPGSMTEYIRQAGLLPADEIRRLIAAIPEEIIQHQQSFARGEPIPSWNEFLRPLAHPHLTEGDTRDSGNASTAPPIADGPAKV